MDALYPFTFQPVYRQYIWGGRRLETVLGKRLPSGDGDFAESWEVVDHTDGQSVVATGSLEGTTLSELVRRRGAELLGRHHPQAKFPLLFKFLDCQRNLSVQIHPNDAQGAQLDPPDLGKTEAWVVLEAEPGSCLYAGLNAGVTRGEFEDALRSGTTEQYLHRIEPKVGDCIFIPAGTVHALGAGLVVAEIQQSSNTTFRLFDWNRVDANGASRPLHIEQGIEVTDFERGPVQVQIPQSTDLPHVDRLVACDKFVLNRVTVRDSHRIGGDETCHLIAVLNGEVDVDGLRLTQGQTLLLPACCGPTEMNSSEATLLDMHLP